jgi:phytanoyl-CoA hydroxylase
MTPHASTRNSSKHPRRTLILSYHAADAFPIYFGEMTVSNEMHARLVRGEQASVARFSSNGIPMPKYPATTASLYQLQELSSDKHTCTNSGSAGNRGSQDLQKPRGSLPTCGLGQNYRV